MMKFFKDLKYHPLVSRIARFTLWPLIKLGAFSEWLKVRLKINGGTIHYFGVSLSFPRNIGVNILSNIYWNGEEGHELLMGRGMAVALKRANILLDVGSNFGFYSVWGQKINPRLRVYCFEPVDHLLEDNKHFHLANKVNRVTYDNRALGNKNGTATILIPVLKRLKFLMTSATLSSDFASHKGFKTISKEVKIVTLDSFASEIREGVGPELHKTVIKIDVEGFEADVLAGGMEFFREYKPLVFIEIFLRDKNIELISNFVNAVRYQVFVPVVPGLVRLTINDLKTFEGDRNFIMLSEENDLSGQNLIPYGHLESYFT